MSRADAVTVYESTVTAVGDLTETVTVGGILILFGENAPVELHPFSVLHAPTITDDGPAAGDTIAIGTQEWTVLAVGEVVRDNLLNLGHLDLKATGATVVDMPGDVMVDATPIALPAIGDAIRITRPA